MFKIVNTQARMEGFLCLSRKTSNSLFNLGSFTLKNSSSKEETKQETGKKKQKQKKKFGKQ